MANTSVENITKTRVFCINGLYDANQHMFLAGLNICLALTTFLWNIVILKALEKESSFHPPSKLLFRCLASTDLCVGLILEPIYITYLMSSRHTNTCYYTARVTSIASGIFLWGITGDLDCYKRGQVSRANAGFEIQADRDFKASSSICHYSLADEWCYCSDVRSRLPLDCRNHMYCDVYLFDDLGLLLYQDLPVTSPSQNSSNAVKYARKFV